MKYLIIFLLFNLTSNTWKSYDGVYVYADSNGWQLTSRTLKIKDDEFWIYGGGHAGYDFYGYGKIRIADSILILSYTKLISTLEKPRREIESLRITSFDTLVIENYIFSDKDFDQGYLDQKLKVDKVYKSNKIRNRLR